MVCPLLFPQGARPSLREALGTLLWLPWPAFPGSIYTGCKQLPVAFECSYNSDSWDGEAGKGPVQALEAGMGIWPGNSRVTWSVFLNKEGCVQALGYVVLGGTYRLSRQISGPSPGTPPGTALL